MISAEPGIYLPGRFGVRIEDVLVLEEGGCRDITQSPKKSHRALIFRIFSQTPLSNRGKKGKMN